MYLTGSLLSRVTPVPVRSFKIVPCSDPGYQNLKLLLLLLLKLASNGPLLIQQPKLWDLLKVAGCAFVGKCNGRGETGGPLLASAGGK